ncbi:MucBP domain-containing protein [Levilactobacillus yonginensis]|uniref:MucBP domain-containing protein n=1 Tax=Levilactobacillus yonginensis TaxID=1054041 RepID=UPI000F782C32|nr:MucBP domain-containing protein [Levilactobacillus yonginensis]
MSKKWRSWWLLLGVVVLGITGFTVTGQAATTGKVVVTYKVADGTVLARKTLKGKVGHQYKTSKKNRWVNPQMYAWNQKQPRHYRVKFTKKTIRVTYKYLTPTAFFRLWGGDGTQMTNIQMDGNHLIFDVSTSLKGAHFLRATNFTKGKVTVNNKVRLTRGKVFKGKISGTTFKSLVITRKRVQATFWAYNKLYTYKFTAKTLKFVHP